MGSVYRLELALLASGDAERAEGIVRELGELVRVDETGGSTWRAEYGDFEDRTAALKALAIDLGRIDRGWEGHLTIG